MLLKNRFFFFFFLLRYLVSVWIAMKHSLTSGVCILVGPVHYSRDPQTTFFIKNNFKTRFHSIIHTFKNYFTTVFSIFSFQFSAISGIQTHPYMSIIHACMSSIFFLLWDHGSTHMNISKWIMCYLIFVTISNK